MRAAETRRNLREGSPRIAVGACVMLRNVRKKAIQADMVKMPFTGYTSQGDSPTILTSGPRGSCGIPTGELSRRRSSQAFAVVHESVLRVQTIPRQGRGSRSSP